MKTLNKFSLQFSLVLVSVFFFAYCKDKASNNFTVTVNYKNLGSMVPQNFGNNGEGVTSQPVKNPKIMLLEIPYGGDMNPIVLDSSTLTSENGTKVLKGNAKEESIFQLSVENGPMLLLINDEDAVNIDIDLSKKENYYTVKGSEASELLKQFITDYSQKSFDVNMAFNELDSLKQFGGSDSLLILSTNKKNTAINNLNSYLQNFLNKSEHPAVSLFALGWSSRSFPKDQFEKTLNATVIKFPEHQTLRKLKTTYDNQQAQASEQTNKPDANSLIGKPAPALALPDVNGDTVTVASFKGKYLLIDFWASWCNPCRQENPNVVKAFNEYKNKNFTILGVSLDQKKDLWIEAIKKDQLAWTHISDLKFWDSKAVEIYQFDGIPYNVLVDPKGIVIAENLRGFDLENKLKEVLQ